MTLSWLTGLVRSRFGRIAGTIACLCLAVAMVTDLALFIDQSSHSMTERALLGLTTDLQVELVPGGDAAAAEQTILDAVPTRAIAQVGYGDVAAFELLADGTTQTTGAGKAVGLAADYFKDRGNDIRLLAGDMSGPVLLQQTAANLHAKPGDAVTLKLTPSSTSQVKVTGVIDLKSADAFFQAIGVPPGSAPTAPPDNAILMPLDTWQQLFPSGGPGNPRTQLHVVIDRTILSPDPNDAYAKAAGLGRNLEARFAGAGVVGNNLAAQLDATRGDALYAKVLFLFLGLPGAILGVLLAFIIARSGQETRARDQALLRLRGATATRRFWLVAAEAGAIGVVAALLGTGLAVAAALILAGIAIGPSAVTPLVFGFFVGVVLAIASVLVPALVTIRGQSVTALRRPEYRTRAALWERLYLDIIVLALSGLIFWRTAASGYQIVLATEGVTATAVDYTAFLSPVLFWIGAGLLAIRLTHLALRRGRAGLTRTVSPLAGTAAPLVSSALSWQRKRLALAVALVALATAFLVSTAVFNATYEAQARVDAELTNGADVTVSGATTTPAGAYIDAIHRLAGVAYVQPMQHRYAYVGTDLQDLYGIDPMQIGRATDLSNAYFQGGNAAATMAALAARADGVLVSEETVNDFQLSLGDQINLRLQGQDHAYHTIPFTFVGVAREFPTAPHDSFLVANAAYVARMTGVDANEVVLIRTTGNIDAVKQGVMSLLTGKGQQVTSLLDAVHTIGTSLTAVDVSGLARIELVFAVLLGAAATGLNLALGFADRRRDFAILKVLGAKGRILRAFVWSEGGLVLVAGIIAGAVTGTIVAEILIVVLQGVFDPPPEAPTVPWVYVIGALAALVGAAAIALTNATWRAEHASVSQMRELR
jgi:putative ABC transport system permease protein